MKDFADSKEKPPLTVAHGLFFIVKTRPADFADVANHIETLRSHYALTDAEVAVAPLFLAELATLCVDARWCVNCFFFFHVLCVLIVFLGGTRKSENRVTKPLSLSGSTLRAKWLISWRTSGMHTVLHSLALLCLIGFVC
jgi:hypothetical protein